MVQKLMNIQDMKIDPIISDWLITVNPSKNLE